MCGGVCECVCLLSPAHTTSHLALVVHSLLLATREEGEGGEGVCVRVWVCGEMRF